MKSMTVSLDGFSLQTQSTIDDTLCCILCSNILENPHQAPCGCRFCFSCISTYLQNNKRICPGQTEYCLETKLDIEKDLRSDILAKRQINKLIVKCPLYLCEEEYEFQKMKDHLNVCSDSIISCIKCAERIRREDFERHERNTCKEMMVSCQFCNIVMKRELLEKEHFNYEHKDLCMKYNDYCPNDCGEKNKVVWIIHRRICQGTFVNCPYENIGCTSVPLLAKEMAKHLTEKCVYHTKMLLKHIDNLNNENQYLKSNLTNLNNEMMTLNNKCLNQENKIGDLEHQIKMIRNTMNESKKINERMVFDIQTKVKFEIDSLKKGQSVEIYRMSEKVKKLKNQLDTIKNKREDQVGERIENSKETEEFPKIDVEKSLEKLNLVLTWPIKKFTTMSVLVSPQYYTHPRGYKMNLKIEKLLKGYISIYACLRAGEYDCDLVWPFRKIITVRILDQDYQGRDFEKNIIFSDKAGSVCDRKYLSNTGDFGYSKFISYDKLHTNSFLLRKDKLLVCCYVTDINPE